MLCMDYKAATVNRRMVRLKLNIEGYLFIETFVRNCPKNRHLPDRFYGSLPSIGNIKGKALHQFGFHDTRDIIVD